MDGGSTDRASAMFANAVAATSTPLRSRPFGSEKMVLTPSLCSAPVCDESPMNTALPRTSSPPSRADSRASARSYGIVGIVRGGP